MHDFIFLLFTATIHQNENAKTMPEPETERANTRSVSQ